MWKGERESRREEATVVRVREEERESGRREVERIREEEREEDYGEL